MGLQPVTIDLGGTSQQDRELIQTAVVASTGVEMQCPVRIGLKRDLSDLWLLPIEPTVSVKASKTIVRRNIAKAAGIGTVKEQWNQDDYEISLTGLLQSADGTFPQADLSKLQAFLAAGKSLVISSRLTDVLGIQLMAVGSWEFPATPGVENQDYSFTGFSDRDFELT